MIYAIVEITTNLGVESVHVFGHVPTNLGVESVHVFGHVPELKIEFPALEEPAVGGVNVRYESF